MSLASWSLTPRSGITFCGSMVCGCWIHFIMLCRRVGQMSAEVLPDADAFERRTDGRRCPADVRDRVAGAAAVLADRRPRPWRTRPPVRASASSIADSPHAEEAAMSATSTSRSRRAAASVAPESHAPLRFAQPRGEQRQSEHNEDDAGRDPHQEAGELLIRERIDVPGGGLPAVLAVPHDGDTVSSAPRALL